MNIDIKKAETCFADLLRRTVAGSDIIITREGQPIVRLVAVRKKPAGKRQFGSAKGLISIAEDFDRTPDDFEEYM
ncbi:MAG: type II toxin-antitoxin system Phd/YefM family antitoxin [Candidatus Electrothrix sp. YB6]